MRRCRPDHDPKEKLKQILARCIPNGECLEWTGGYKVKQHTKEKTYPEIYWMKKHWRGNRLVLAIITNNFDTKEYALHSCDNMKCLNPKHLRWGTHEDNIKDMYSRERAWNSKTKLTRCKYGHKYSGDNLRITNGFRYCKTCQWYRSRKLKVGKELKFNTGEL